MDRGGGGFEAGDVVRVSRADQGLTLLVLRSGGSRPVVELGSLPSEGWVSDIEWSGRCVERAEDRFYYHHGAHVEKLVPKPAAAKKENQ